MSIGDILIMRISQNGNMPEWLSKVADEIESAEQVVPDQDELKDRGSYSLGECPAEVILKAAHEQCPNGYNMIIKSQDEWDPIVEAVNQGIDPHLEAFTKSTFDEKTGKCNIHPDELPILLRRLFESESASGWALRTDILSTLGISET